MDARPLSELTPAERDQRIADNACVPAKDLRALIAVLIAKGVITAKDMEKANARTP
jgi:hypothetical protein